MARDSGGRPGWLTPGLLVNVVGVVLMGLGLIPVWLPWLERAGWDPGGLFAALRLLHRLWRVLLGAGVLLLVWYAARRWREGWVRWARERYLRALWRLKWLVGMAKGLYLWLLSDVLARPVREELAVRLAEACGLVGVAGRASPLASLVGALYAVGARSDDDLRAAVPGLSVAALQVLFRGLEGVEQGSLIVVRGSTIVRVEVYDLRATWGGTTEEVSLKVVREGCRTLEAAGLIKEHSAFSKEGHEAMAILLAECLSGRAEARKVRQWVNDELVERGVWDF